MECKFAKSKSFESCRVCRVKKQHKKLKSIFGPFFKTKVFFSPTGELNLKKFCSEKCFSSNSSESCRLVKEKRKREFEVSLSKRDKNKEVLNKNKQTCENSCEKSLIEAVDCREKNLSSSLPFKRCYKCINKVSNTENNFDCEKCLAKEIKCQTITAFEYPETGC
jgi:hypothetical protein